VAAAQEVRAQHVVGEMMKPVKMTKMKRRDLRRVLLGALTCTLAACASDLPQEREIRRPVGIEVNLDLTKINLFDLATEQSVNLADYMETSGRDYLLLAFGSRGCTACNEKSIGLRDQVIGKHPLYDTAPGKRFEIVGVNTDPDPPQVIRTFLAQARFSFVKWSDPRGLTMMEYFMPAGSGVGVPLTVMITRTGISWRLTKDDKVDLPDLVAKIESTLGIAGDGRGIPPVTQPPVRPPVVLPPPSALARETPGRLRSVYAEDCSGEKSDLGALLGDPGFSVIQAVRGSCAESGACRGNATEIQAVCPPRRTELLDAAPTCQSISLQAAALPQGSCSAELESGVRTGGTEFFAEFSTHFNWNDTVLQDADGQTRLASVAGPLVMVFARDGRLVFSREGSVTRDELAAVLADASTTTRARGPDFRFHGIGRGEFRFGDVRPLARYTVVSAFGKLCTSCMSELKHWSKTGELVDYCAASNGGCQVFGVENGLPEDGQSIDEYLGALQNGDDFFDGFARMGIRVPYAIDPQPMDDADGLGYLRRFFDGYLMAQFPGFGLDFRTVIYDRDGRIVAVFKAEGVTGDDPVLTRLKSLLSEPIQ